MKEIREEIQAGWTIMKTVMEEEGRKVKLASGVTSEDNH